MLSASSIVRWLLAAAVVGASFAEACAFAPDDASATLDGGCTFVSCPGGGDAGGGQGAATSEDASASDGESADNPDAGPAPLDDGGDPVQSNGDGGDWINMTNDASACEGQTGAPCGWSATNNGSVDTCACRHGNWAEGWTCEPVNTPLTPGPACPNIPDDAGSGDAAVPVTDAAPSNTDAGGWVDMTNNASACDDHPGTACGWNLTNNGTGYTCGCRHGDWADGWTCEAAGSAVTPGPSCPDAGP